MKKIGMRAKKKDPGDWCENGNEDSQNAVTTLWSLQQDGWVQVREEQQVVEHRKCVAVLSNDHILAFGELFETSFTSSNFFSVCFAIFLILLILRCMWPTVPKTHPVYTYQQWQLKGYLDAREAYTVNMYWYQHTLCDWPHNLVIQDALLRTPFWVAKSTCVGT